MKTAIALAALVCLATASCKKSHDEHRAITGKWELREETGGIAGKISYKSGNSTVLIFNSSREFQTVYINAPAINGVYDVKESAKPGDYLLNLNYQLNGQSQSRTDSIRFEKNQLVVLPPASCCDFSTSFYDRIP